MKTHRGTKFSLALGFAVIFSLLLTSLALALNDEIDHYDNGDPITLTANVGNPSAGISGNTTAIGGERDLSLSTTAGSATAVINPPTHYLVFGTGPGASNATLQVQYDGLDNSTTLNPVGLGGINLFDAGNIGFHIEVVYCNQPVNLIIQAYTDATHWSQRNLVIPGDVNLQNHVDFFMRFSTFNTAGPGAAGPVNFNSVGALVLILNATNPNTDFRLDYIEASNKEDFGDLPITGGYNYGTASHVPNGMRLGSNLDTEPPPGSPSINADGDDYNNTPNDEDGVVRTPNVNWAPGTGGGSVNVTVKDCGSSCYLSAWFDWNNDGDFSDPGEKVFTPNEYLVSNGTQTITFNIPVGTIINNGTFYSRFRLYPFNPSGGSSPIGDILGGEVEDYKWNFGPTAVTIASLQAHTNPSNTVLLWLALGILICASIILAYTIFQRRKA